MENTQAGELKGATEATASVPIKRLNIALTEQAYADLDRLSKDTRHSMTELLRLGLGLVTLAWEEKGRRNKLVIADPNLKPLREIVLPL